MKKILFVNPNKYLTPPVIPIGIEYVAHVLREHGYGVEVIDLCFSQDPLKDIEKSINDSLPDAVCFTIRNIDSALYMNNEYFLPEIKGYIFHVKNLSDAPVIIGGAALPVDPPGILYFLGADIAIVGPGEQSLPLILNDEEILKKKGTIIRGRLPMSFCPARGNTVSYGQYLERDGIAGFETHKGCTASCAYCIEAGSPVVFKRPADVVGELRELAEKGVHHLHLCDSEFNEDLDFSLEVLDAMVREGPDIRWTLYMKPGDYNRRLFKLLKDSGAYLITLTADTFHKCPGYWTDIESMVYLAKKSGIAISIDLLSGFPYETEDTLKDALDFFWRIEPDDVVVNVHIRIYGNTQIKGIIERDLALRGFIKESGEDDHTYLSPRFYNHIPDERLKELIRGGSLFRIAGEERGVNYQNVRSHNTFT
jgi:Radical SAM superfamily/B12 binding domain